MPQKSYRRMSVYTTGCSDSQAAGFLVGQCGARCVLLFALDFCGAAGCEHGHGEVAAAIYRAFGTLCHQLPERSYFIDGHKLAVCSRCTGLYAGFVFNVAALSAASFVAED